MNGTDGTGSWQPPAHYRPGFNGRPWDSLAPLAPFAHSPQPVLPIAAHPVHSVGDATFTTWSALSCLLLAVCRPSCRLALAGTIQFSSAIQLARQRLSARYPSLSIPKCKPLSPGEVLGCTAPALNADDVDAIVFVADGRCGCMWHCLRQQQPARLAFLSA